MKYPHALGLVGVIASCVPAPNNTPQVPAGASSRVVNVVAELPVPKAFPTDATGFHTQGVVLPSLTSAEIEIEGFGLSSPIATTSAVSFNVGPPATYTVSKSIPNVPEGRNRLIRVIGRDSNGFPLPGVMVEAVVDIPGTGTTTVNPQSTIAAQVFHTLGYLADKSTNKALFSLMANLNTPDLVKLVDKIMTNQSLTDPEQVDFMKVAGGISQWASSKSPDFFFSNFTPLPADSDFATLVATPTNLSVTVNAPANFPHLDNPAVDYELAYHDRSSPILGLNAPPYANSSQNLTGAYLKPYLPLTLTTLQAGFPHTRLQRTPSIDATNTIGFHSTGLPVPMRPVKFSPLAAPPGATIKVEIDTSVTPGSVSNYFGSTTGKVLIGEQAMTVSSWANGMVEFLLPNAMAPGMRNAVVESSDRNLQAELFKLSVLPGTPEIYRAFWNGTQVVVEGKNFSSNSSDNKLTVASTPTLATATIGPPDALTFNRGTPIVPATQFLLNIGDIASNAYKFRRLAYSRLISSQWDIMAISEDGSTPVNLTNIGGNDQSPDWAPNGLKLAFWSDRDGNGEIYVMNDDGSSQTNITNDPSGDKNPRWTPDGLKLVFSSNRTGNEEIFIMGANGASPTNLTDNGGQDTLPAVSPDGSKIAFVSTRDGNPEIYVMNVDGTGQSRLTNNAGSDQAPQWSPDGSKIAFHSNRDGDDEIWVMNADGSNQTQLTSNTAIDQSPVWTPDGRRIAFMSDRDAGDFEIYFMAADGGAPVRVTNSAGADAWPDWGP